MGRAFGYIGLLAVVAIMGFLYTRNAQSISGTSAPPRTVIDLTGVQNDLISMANAERQYQASNGKYASLEDLQANGTMNLSGRKREGWTYSSQADEQSFKIIATYSGPALEGVPSQITIDQNMAIVKH